MFSLGLHYFFRKSTAPLLTPFPHPTDDEERRRGLFNALMEEDAISSARRAKLRDDLAKVSEGLARIQKLDDEAVAAAAAAAATNGGGAGGAGGALHGGGSGGFGAGTSVNGLLGGAGSV